MSVIQLHQIDIDNIKLSDPKKVNSVYYSSITYDNLPLIIQLGRINITHDLKEINNSKYPSIEFEIPENKQNIYDFFVSLDDVNIKETILNSSQWFKQDIPKEVIDEMYKRISKPLKKNINAKLRFKLPVSKGNIQCNVYNSNKELVKIEDIEKDTPCTIILHIRGLKFLKQHYICDCYISQIKLYETDNNIHNHKECLINDNYNNYDDNDIIDNEILTNIDNINKLQDYKLLLKEKENQNSKLDKEINNLKKRISNLDKKILLN